MRFLRKILDEQANLFKKGSKLEKLYPLYEAQDTFLYTPGHVTHGASHVRDGLDLKRMMVTVVVALIPCILFAMYNTGLQASLAIAAGATPLDDWRTALFTSALGMQFDPHNVWSCFVHGALYFLPVLMVSFAAGGLAEAVFSIVRKHEINEGFLVTGFLYPLTLPPTIPLWQAVIGIIFGVVIGKEIFGGTGMNVLNPALTARAFLFFAYPAQISGDLVWIAANTQAADGLSGATLLSRAANSADALHIASWSDAFWGMIPGSMGETSFVACALGALVLILTKVGSWRTMAGVVLGTLGMSLLFNSLGSTTNPMFAMPFHWHVVLGGWAFGTVFMATDPVSSSFTNIGKLIYGACIGMLVVMVRVVNPAYPEGMMLSILFMNMFAPLIDYYVIKANIKRRMARYAA